MSTRRAGELRFDHGAQYFTARDPRFADQVLAWEAAGVVARWHGRIAVLARGETAAKNDATTRYVGVPGMNAPCKHLATGMEVLLETRIDAVHREADRWRLDAEGGRDLGTYDAVVVSAPAPQTATLLADAAPELARLAAETPMAPCWAALAAFPHALPLDFDGAFVHDAPLSWVARNGSKPGRPAPETWILHASPAWSENHLELDPDTVSRQLLAAFEEAAGIPLPEPVYRAAHRWRYALPHEARSETCLFDADLRLAVCGDWCNGPQVEGAFLSGRAAAERLLSPRTRPASSILSPDA